MNRKFTLVMGHANEPERRIDSYVRPRGCLTKPGMPNRISGCFDSSIQ